MGRIDGIEKEINHNVTSEFQSFRFGVGQSSKTIVPGNHINQIGKH